MTDSAVTLRRLSELLKLIYFVYFQSVMQLEYLWGDILPTRGGYMLYKENNQVCGWCTY